jgi:hypothetical protein
MKKRILYTSIVVLALVFSCDYKKGLLPKKAASISANACDSIKYSNGVKFLIDNACISCHSGPFGSGGVDLTTYANASMFASDVKRRITNTTNPMPPFGLLPQAKVVSIICGVDKGAPQ